MKTGKSLIKIKEKIGPREDPCVTPSFVGQIDYEKFKIHGPEIWNRGNNHFARVTLFKYLGLWSLKDRSCGLRIMFFGPCY